MNFNIEIGKMLEIIAKYPSAKHFAYAILIAFLLFAVVWKLPEFLTALSLYLN